MKHPALISLAALALVVGACSPAVSATASPESPSASTSLVDIVETATAAGSLGTLLEAATATGLVETLQGVGPFTVFAPTDAAFAALPTGTLEALLADPEALKQVLLHHVVPGRVMAGDVVGLTEATSVEGSDIAISVVDGVVTLNGTAKVVTTDVEASSGVIHVIDAVILPPAG